MRPVPIVPCLGLIHAFEKGPNGSFAATAYQDSGGVWTIGWGHVLPGPTEETWDQAQADTQAVADAHTAADGVSTALGDIVDGLTDGQYAALIDFTFNLGVGAFEGSTLCRLVKEGNMVLAPGEFGKWVYGTVDGQKVVLPGLVRRRAAEVAVWKAS